MKDQKYFLYFIVTKSCARSPKAHITGTCVLQNVHVLAFCEFLYCAFE